MTTDPRVAQAGAPSRWFLYVETMEEFVPSKRRPSRPIRRARFTDDPQKDGGQTAFNSMPVENDLGVGDVFVVLDPENVGDVGEQAREWKEGDLVKFGAPVVSIEVCDCCGKPALIVEAVECARVLS